VTDETTTNDYDRRSQELWAAIDEYSEQDFLAKIEALVRDLPPESALAPFERACAFDSTGHPDQAVPLYREALARGLDPYRRRRATIQMASSLRNLGHADESVALLQAERTAQSDELDDAVSATLALALVDTGREREAVSIALSALAPHLPRYQRSVANYARDLLTGE